jgi:hypothetical protein
MLLLRVLHSMFEHVDSGIYRGLEMKRWRLSMEEANNGGTIYIVFGVHSIREICSVNLAKRGTGVRLEDIMELFSCCACSIEDEQRIHRHIMPVIQVLAMRSFPRSFSCRRINVAYCFRRSTKMPRRPLTVLRTDTRSSRPLPWTYYVSAT